MARPSFSFARLAAATLVAGGVAMAIARAASADTASEAPANPVGPATIEQVIADCAAKAAQVEDDDPDAVHTHCLAEAAKDLVDPVVAEPSALMAQYRTASQEFCWTRIMGAHVRGKGDNGGAVCILRPEEEYAPTDDDYRFVERCTLEQHRTLLAVALKHGMKQGALADKVLPAPKGASAEARTALVKEIAAIDDCQPNAKKRLELWQNGISDLCQQLTHTQGDKAPAVEACRAEVGERAAGVWNSR